MSRNADLPRSAAGPNSPWLIAVIVSIATFMEVLDTTIANVALRHIAGTLAAGQDESTYVVTSFLVSNAIVLPISGWLAVRFGRQRFFLGCLAIFTLSSVLCGFASSLGMLSPDQRQGLRAGKRLYGHTSRSFETSRFWKSRRAMKTLPRLPARIRPGTIRLS